MADTGEMTEGADPSTIRRVRAAHRAAGFDSKYGHVVEMIPTPDGFGDDPDVIAVIRRLPEFDTDPVRSAA